ncbi:hypothetical protein JVU11DRAFT_5765 [Chiua virens]|nr:hypothetical protein JVU11DRAFT_5765 [Chiua virens]
MSTPGQLLAQLLSRLLKILASVGRFNLKSPLTRRLLKRLVAFFSRLLRWLCIFNPRKRCPRQLRQRTPAQSATSNNVVCTMSVPSPRHTHDHDQQSPVDSRSYATGNAAASGLTSDPAVPASYIPDPARRYSRPSITWAQTPSLQDEPSTSRYNAPETDPDPTPWTDSSATVHSCQGNPAPNSDIPETSSLTSGPPSWSLAPVSDDSGDSIGRASHREHGMQPTSASAQDDVAALGHITQPNANDSETHGVQRYDGCRFFPMSVNGVLRYDKRKIRPPWGDNYMIAAMLYQYPETPEVPEGWTAYRHPEGALYFVHDQSKTFTEVDICDPEIHEDIEYFRIFLFTELQAEIKNRNLSESLDIDQVQLVLEPKVDDLGAMCCYYFVNPRTRCLFWLDEWEAYEVFKDCRGRLSVPHKGLAIQAQYWSHWDLYPNFCEITQELKDEVVDMILHATCDHLTSNRSACPLNPEELKHHLSLIERIIPEKLGKRGHCAIVVGRIMHIFYNSYFLNFYGEDCARLNYDQSIHGWRYHPSLFMTAVAPLLFMAPMHKVWLLHKIFVDEVVSADKWNMFVTKLSSELRGTIVLAIVLLNAYVGFLPRQLGTGTSPQQLLDYMSLVTSMASVILSLVFMGHAHNGVRSTPFEAAKFLHGLKHERHGLETLAIVYSLPNALLAWSIVLFITTFAVEWCYSGDATARACIGAFMLIIALLVAGCIWTTRVRSDFWWFQPDPEQPEMVPESEKNVPEENIIETGLHAIMALPSDVSQLNSDGH